MMTHEIAAETAARSALFISRLIREGKIRGKDKNEAADIGVDLHLLAQHHEKLRKQSPDPAPSEPA